MRIPLPDLPAVRDLMDSARNAPTMAESAAFYRQAYTKAFKEPAR